MALRREGEFFARGGYGENPLRKLPDKKEKNSVTQGGFDLKVNKLAGAYSGQTRLGDLRIPPEAMSNRDYAAFGFFLNQNPPDGWAEFYNELGRAEKRLLSTSLDKAMRAGFRTVGDIRQATIYDLQLPKKPGSNESRITTNTANFLKNCFDVQDPLE